MSRAHAAIAYRQPHVALGLSMPAGRKMAKAAKSSWAVLLLVLTAACAGAYVYQMNRAATKGYSLRELDRKLEVLQDQVMVLEDEAAKKQALRTIEEQVKGLGYVPVDRVDFVDVGRNAYAIAE